MKHTRRTLIVCLYFLIYAQLSSYQAYCGNETCKEYYPNGVLKLEASQKNGMQDGITKTYNLSGKLQVEANYKDGKQDGITKEYYESGELYVETHYKNGIQDGITKTYYKSGKPEKVSQFKNGQKEGRYEEYYENGTLRLEANYKDGVSKAYYENGKVSMEGNYKDGKQDGISKVYYENGKVSMEVNYKNGKQDGIRKAYYPSGKLLEEANYKDGKLDGITKRYYESGVIMEEENYKDNMYEGVHKQYYKSGKLKQEEKWTYDKQLSMVCYNEQGEIVPPTVWWQKKLQGKLNSGCELIVHIKGVHAEGDFEILTKEDFARRGVEGKILIIELKQYGTAASSQDEHRERGDRICYTKYKENIDDMRSKSDLYHWYKDERRLRRLSEYNCGKELFLSFDFTYCELENAVEKLVYKDELKLAGDTISVKKRVFKELPEEMFSMDFGFHPRPPH